MANTKAAIKDIKQTKKLTVYNKKIKDNFKSLIKKTKTAITTKSKDAEKMLFDSMKALDKAAQKGVIKKNTRDRKKSRLHMAFNKLQK